MKPSKQGKGSPKTLSQTTQNPSLKSERGGDTNGSNGRSTAVKRYFAPLDDAESWPPELSDYNKRFTSSLEKIKTRHDGVVPTVGRAAFFFILAFSASMFLPCWNHFF